MTDHALITWLSCTAHVADHEFDPVVPCFRRHDRPARIIRFEVHFEPGVSHTEIAQPVSMAFRHFGNVAGGGVITSILYTALSMLSAIVLNAIASLGWLTGIVLMAAGSGLWILGSSKKKLALKIFAVISFVLGLFGLLQSLGVLSGVPVFAFGIPAVLSLYFDLFSGFVQALVFSLLSMVYIAGSCPPPEEADA